MRVSATSGFWGNLYGLVKGLVFASRLDDVELPEPASAPDLAPMRASKGISGGAGAHATADVAADGREQQQQREDSRKPAGPLAEAVDSVSRAVGGGSKDGVGGIP